MGKLRAQSAYPVQILMQHIAIDARMYGTAQRGIGRYLVKLIQGLEEIESAPHPLLTSPIPAPEQVRYGAGKGEETIQNSPPLVGGVRGGENQYTIFLRRANFEEYIPHNPNFKKALWDVPWYGWREQFTRYTLHATRYTLFHFPHWNVPLFFNRPFVVTIHDLELFSSNRTRENSTRGRLMYYLKHLAFRIIFRHAVLAARAIIVPSNFVREQLLDMYPSVRKKVRVVYEAPTITPTVRYTLHATRYTPYALYVGAAYPHKNLPRLIDAWQILHEKLPDHKLVLVGREDFFWHRLKTTHYKLLTTPSIVFYGSATDAELAVLYKNAALLVQPSLEEGFSLSPLEALSFGTPVAASDIAVHREILKDAAHYFNPTDTNSIASAIIGALSDPTSRIRAQQEGPELLKRYSWHTHTKETLAIYQASMQTV